MEAEMRSGKRSTLLVASLTSAFFAACSSAAVIVSASYYDTEHASPSKPNPWSGSPNTTFFGFPDVNGIWDTGGILFFNAGPTDAVISPGLKIDGFANGASFQSWDADIGAGFTLHSGQSVIFAGHGSGAFDSSDQPIITDPNLRTNNKPQIHVTVDGRAFQFSDDTQVLNTGGFDPGEAFHTSESLPWAQVGTTPEPGSLLLGVGLISLLAIRRRAAR
jgi:hypothetical protein